jgi:hypothetical protein
MLIGTPSGMAYQRRSVGASRREPITGPCVGKSITTSAGLIVTGIATRTPTSGLPVLVHLGELALDLALKARWISLRNEGQDVLELLSLPPHAKFFHPTSVFPVDILPKHP